MGLLQIGAISQAVMRSFRIGQAFKVLTNPQRKKYKIDFSDLHRFIHEDHSDLKEMVGRIKGAALAHYHDIIDGEDPYMESPPEVLHGNRNIWEVVEWICDPEGVAPLVTPYSLTSRRGARIAATSMMMRSPEICESAGLPRESANDMDGGILNEAINLRSWAEMFRRMRADANQVNKRWVAVMNSCAWDPDEPPILSVGDHTIQLLQANGIFLLATPRHQLVMLGEHMDRLIWTLKSLSNAVLLAAFVPVRRARAHGIMSMLSTLSGIGLDHPEAVGEYIKASRNLLVASLDEDCYLGTPSADLLFETYSPKKQRLATSVLRAMRKFTDNTHTLILMSLFYKAVPHPDMPPHSCFTPIEGLRDPNNVSPAMLRLFRCILKKNMALSLLRDGIQVRTEPPEEPESPEGIIYRALSSTSVNVQGLEEFHLLSWERVVFSENHRIQKAADVEVKAANKASAAKAKISENDVAEIRKWMKRGGYMVEAPPEVVSNLKNVNDLQSVLTGKDQLDLTLALERFADVIRMHEEFESRYPGMTPEQIPADDLEAFLYSHPHLAYVVGTEPKLGEKHKEITRIFYMAEQQLKVITQSSERILRNMSRRQKGVSIVKSYTSRRKDLEAFAAHMRHTMGDRRSVFVSFDMSRFSMKFPMILVRELGQVMSQFTGEPHHARLDLCFRNSIVFHNTRGYAATLAGVKGGFEGFFNFIWSSIHATVMDVALYRAQVDGTLLAYSDDGLLHYTVDDDDLEAARIVKEKAFIIQSTYSDLGLEFHFGKTVMSSTVWEYLGDVCWRGVILPMFGKELMSIGTVEAKRGFSPRYDTFATLAGQARAAVKAQCPSGLAAFVMYWEASMEVLHITPGATDDLVHALLIIPAAAGGFRMPAPMELSLVSNLTSDSEFMADIQLLSRKNKQLAERIVAAILDSKPNVRQMNSGILSGTLVRTNHPDVSGRGVAMRLADKLARKKALPGNPVTKDIEADLITLLKDIVNLKPRFISDYISSTPAMTTYSSLLAQVRSRGALRLLSRDDLKDAQNQDTRNVRESISRWAEICQTGRRTDIYRLEDVIFSQWYRDFTLSPPIPSPRIGLARALDGENADLVVHVDLRPSGEEVSAWELSYSERSINPATHDDTLRWAAEASPESEMAQLRRMLSLYASALFSEPSMGAPLQLIARMLGTVLPPIPPMHAAGADRRRAHHGTKPDVVMSGPEVLIARSYTSIARGWIVEHAENSDCTTYPAAARLMVIEDLISRSALTSQAMLTQHVVKMNLLDRRCIERRFMDAFGPWPDLDRKYPCATAGRLPRPVMTELRATLEERRLEMDYRAAFQTSIGQGMADDVDDREEICAILARSVETALISLISPNRTQAQMVQLSVAAIRSPPSLMNGAAAAFLRSIPPADGRIVRRWVVTAQHGDMAIVMNNAAQYAASLRGLSTVAPGIQVPWASLAAAFEDPQQLRSMLRTHVLGAFITPAVTGAIIVIPEAGAGSMSASKQGAGVLRSMARNTLQAMSDVVQRANAQYPPEGGADPGRLSAQRYQEAAEAVGLTRASDAVDVISWLVVLRHCCRPSAHRSLHHIVNPTTLRIRLAQIYALEEDLSLGGGAYFDRRVGTTMRQKYADKIIDYLQRNRAGGDLGPDHIAMIRERVPSWLIRRADEARVDRGRVMVGEVMGAGRAAMTWVREASLLASSTYSSILQGVLDRIIEVPRSTAHLYEIPPEPVIFSTVRSLGPRPRAVLTNIVPTIRRAVGSIVVDYFGASAAAGIPISANMPGGIATAISEMSPVIISEAPYSLRWGNVDAPNSPVICVYQFDNMEELGRAFLYASAITYMRARIVPLYAAGAYYLVTIGAKAIGARNQWMDLLEQRGITHRDRAWEPREGLEAVSPHVWDSVDALVSSTPVSVESAQEIHPGQLVLPQGIFPLSGFQSSASRAESVPVAVSLAKAVKSSATSDVQSLYAYALMRCALSGLEEPNPQFVRGLVAEMGPLLHEFHNAPNLMPLDRRRRAMILLADVRATMTWLSQKSLVSSDTAQDLQRELLELAAAAYFNMQGSTLQMSLPGLPMSFEASARWPMRAIEDETYLVAEALFGAAQMQALPLEGAAIRREARW
jgi:hypothetical protein